MYINPKWRILTIGDGDLSFSCALLSHYRPKLLTATIFDDEQSLISKYGDSHLRQLRQQNCDVLTGFDVTNAQSWQGLLAHHYDVVIFQFPLLPAFSSVNEFQTLSAQVSINTLHRRLLRQYLLNSFEHFLSPFGAGLAYITSKDVKPYQQWNIETSLLINTDIVYLGACEFELANFPGYRIRNVDRDKHVKATQGFTYVYSKSEFSQTQQGLEFVHRLQAFDFHGNKFCPICRAGPFYSVADKMLHQQTKKHQQMLTYEQQWLSDINRD